MSSSSTQIQGILAGDTLRRLRMETSETTPSSQDDLVRSVSRITPPSSTATASMHVDIMVAVGKNVSAGLRFSSLLPLSTWLESPPGISVVTSAPAFPALPGIAVDQPWDMQQVAQGALASIAGFSSSSTPPRIALRGAGTSLLPEVSSWLDETVREISSFEISEQTKKDAETVVTLCAQMPLAEPLVEVDQNGNLELFFKSGPSGVILVITVNRLLQLIGNENGEKWRAQYTLDGHIWKRELPGKMKAFAV